MITNSAIRQEMLGNGFTEAGKGDCEKCHEPVEFLLNPSGKRKIAINLPDHPERPGMLHSMGCGVKLE